MSEVTLRDYVDRMFEEFEKRQGDRFRQGDVAIAKAEAAMNARLDGMNEFRQALTDQARQFVTRAEHDKLDARLQEQEKRSANQDGRFAVIAVAVSVATSLVTGVLLLIAGHFLNVRP